MIWRELEGDIVIVACAISAGIHAALAPHHLEESAATGAGFVAATLLLAVLIVALTFRPRSAPLLAATALIFGGLLVSYALAVTTGVPVLQPEPEPIDGLALFTKAVEAIGLTLALDSLRSHGAARSPFSLNRPEGVRR